MNLNEIRKKLDKIDRNLVALVAERNALIPEVAKYKKENDIPRYQPERESELLKAKREIALEMDVDPDLIENILKLLIEESHKIQKKILGE